eukprot:494012_1
MGCCKSCLGDYKYEKIVVESKLHDSSEDDINTIICNQDSVKECSHFLRLFNAMKIYHEHNSYQNINENFISLINIYQLFDAYTHLLYKHDDDENYAIINASLPSCNIMKCGGFKRNCRDRSKYKKNHTVSLEILDKIHSYYSHSYNIGNRLTINETNMIYDDSKSDIDSGIEINHVSKELMKIKQILRNKKLMNDSTVITRSDRANKKSEQILINSPENKQNIFHFGYGFEYGYDAEYMHYEDEMPDNPNLSVFPKHDSLKDELLNNSFTALTVEQYNNEYRKASIYLGSYYCKSTCGEFTQECKSHYVFGHKSGTVSRRWVFSIQHILSLVIYCNYTNLQYEFSKTYRENDGKDHDQFYHLGKNLKIAVHKFGQEMRAYGSSDTLYHGICEMTHFEHYADHCVYVQCPLSTTTSMAVAMHYSGVNGMMIEFGSTKGHAKYFDVEWISDYGGEKECLFVQNDVTSPLNIENICDVSSSIEYRLILNALRYINIITTELDVEIEDFEDGLWKEMELPYIESHIETLIIHLIHHQLSLTNSSYESSKSLTEYGKGINDRYFQKDRTNIYLDYVMKEANWTELFEEFWDNQHRWIKIRKIIELFPSSEHITVCGAELNKYVFEDLLRVAKDKMMAASKLKIHINTDLFKQEEVFTSDKIIVNAYNSRFEEIGYQTNRDPYEDDVSDKELYSLNRRRPKTVHIDFDDRIIRVDWA